MKIPTKSLGRQNSKWYIVVPSQTNQKCNPKSCYWQIYLCLYKNLWYIYKRYLVSNIVSFYLNSNQHARSFFFLIMNFSLNCSSMFTSFKPVNQLKQLPSLKQLCTYTKLLNYAALKCMQMTNRGNTLESISTHVSIYTSQFRRPPALL